MRSRQFLFVTITGLVLFQLPLCWAEPKLSAELSGQEISLNETVLLTLQAEWPKPEADYKFAFPNLPLENLSVERQGESEEIFSRNGEEWIQKQFVTELKATQAGRASIRPFIVTYLDPATQKTGTFNVSELSLKIKNPPVGMTLFLPFLFLLTVPTAGIILWIVTKRRKHSKLETQAPLSREEAAIQKMNATFQNSTGKTSNQLLTEAAQQLKHFIADYYQVQNEEVVTERDLLEILKRKDIPKSEIESLSRLLDQIHEAKYSGGALAESHLQSFQQQMVTYIESKRVVGEVF